MNNPPTAVGGIFAFCAKLLGIDRLWGEGQVVHVSTPSVDSSWGMKMLPSVLSMIAGSADVIGFLGFGGLFIAHITGKFLLYSRSQFLWRRRNVTSSLFSLFFD